MRRRGLLRVLTTASTAAALLSAASLLTAAAAPEEQPRQLLDDGRRIGRVVPHLDRGQEDRAADRAFVAADGVALPPASASLVLVPARITAGTRPSFKFEVANTPVDSVRYLQQRFGTAHAWRNVVRLSRVSGGVTAPAVPRGRYVYRVQVVRNGVTVVNSRTRVVYAYGDTPFGTLCQSTTGARYCGPDFVSVGATVFEYTARSYSNSASYAEVFSMPRSSCRSVSLEYASRDPAGNEVDLQVRQGFSHRRYSHVGRYKFGTFTVALDGGPWVLGVRSTDGDDVVYAGTASCYTADGTR
jgi:hypothetical protein